MFDLIGKRVHGVYVGVSFEGTVADVNVSDARTGMPCTYAVTVDLDSPIMIGESERSFVRMYQSETQRTLTVLE